MRTSTPMTKESNEIPITDQYKPGDHIYVTRYFTILPFQHHGIVITVPTVIAQPDDVESVMSAIMVVEFNFADETYDINSISASIPEFGVTGAVSVVSLTEFSRGSPVKKVIYGVEDFTPFISNGKTTGAKSDPPPLIVARSRHILKHPELIPTYNLWTSNCECIAVWCCTGKWQTIQVATLLSRAFAGGFTAPLWSKCCELLFVPPQCLGIIGACGIASTLTPLVAYLRFRDKWERTARVVNKHFWCSACPDIFAKFYIDWVNTNQGMLA